mmetsp:Transcript_57217/g.130656  ORF Transcript_57217/g.130656 Transcript_57217/m.130656 type:complete len:289 (+) Transcript_57217:61-927(+)
MHRQPVRHVQGVRTCEYHLRERGRPLDRGACEFVGPLVSHGRVLPDPGSIDGGPLQRLQVCRHVPQPRPGRSRGCVACGRDAHWVQRQPGGGAVPARDPRHGDAAGLPAGLRPVPASELLQLRPGAPDRAQRRLPGAVRLLRRCSPGAVPGPHRRAPCRAGVPGGLRRVRRPARVRAGRPVPSALWEELHPDALKRPEQLQDRVAVAPPLLRGGGLGLLPDHLLRLRRLPGVPGRDAVTDSGADGRVPARRQHAPAFGQVLRAANHGRREQLRLRHDVEAKAVRGRSL